MKIPSPAELFLRVWCGRIVLTINYGVVPIAGLMIPVVWCSIRIEPL